MTAAKAKKPTGSVPQSAKPTYTFRAGWALFLLAGNLLIAAIYFHIVNP